MPRITIPLSAYSLAQADLIEPCDVISIMTICPPF